MEEESPFVKLGKLLRTRRHERNWPLKYLERRTGLDHSYLSRLERGVQPGRIPYETLGRLANGYELPLPALQDALAGADVAPPVLAHSVQDLLEQARMLAPIAIPVVEHPAHAGHGGTPVLDYVYAEPAFAANRNLVCVPVRGRCMEPRIEDGDRVIVDRDKWPDRGDMVLAVVDEAVLVRRFYPSNGHIVLRTDAPGYEDITVPEVAILGVVVEIRKRP